MRFNHHGVLSNIDDLPGCSQIGVFHSVFVPLGQRSNGLGAKGHQERLAEAERLGYDTVLCTAQLSNTAQISILEANHWTHVHSFTSSKTGNLVGVFIKDLS